MTCRCLISLSLALLAFGAQAADKPAPQPGMGIAAVVGEEAISSYDIENRLKFVLVTARLSNTPETLQRVRPQVARQLIDERLQMQEAQRQSIEISDKEVADAIAGIEAQRGMKPGSILAMLKDNNVPTETFTRQIRAQLAWGRLVQKKLRPRIRISDEEIALMRKKLATPRLRQELEIALLVLPVDKPAREGDVKTLGDKFVQEVRGGASFEELSRQFSSSSDGGRVEKFWVRPEQLDPGIARLLENARAGMVTDPLRGPEGFTIIKVYNTRALEEQGAEALSVMLKEIVLKLKNDASEKEAGVMLDIGKEVARHPGSCEDKGVAGVEGLDDFSIEVNQIRNTMAELPAALRTIAENLTVGGISPPFASSEGIKLYMLCEKSNVAAANIDREQVAQLLTNQKLQLEAQKYLRNLRRETFIEIR